MTTVALIGDSTAAMWSPASSRSPRSDTGGGDPYQDGLPTAELRLYSTFCSASTPSASSGALRSSTGYGPTPAAGRVERATRLLGLANKVSGRTARCGSTA